MKKISLFILTALLMIPCCAFALSKPKVLTLNAEASASKITYSGVTEEGSHAVMCKLYNSESEEIDKLSVAVSKTKFEGEFTVLENDTYTVYCANYEGGEITKTEVKVEEKGEETYTLDDEEGIIISFKDEKGKKFFLLTTDLLNLKADELTEEENKMLVEITDKVKEYGSLISLYDFIITDVDSDEELHEGPFTIKIKMTEEMKKYNSFSLIYVDDDFKIEKPIELKIEDDCLVGTLNHLSGYVLVGNNVEKENPKTGDNVSYLIMTLVISGLGLGILLKKRNA